MRDHQALMRNLAWRTDAIMLNSSVVQNDDALMKMKENKRQRIDYYKQSGQWEILKKKRRKQEGW